jgi:cell division protein ZapA (FtsZ GTPase activity inhibitor)
MTEPAATTAVTILGEEYRFRGASPELVSQLARMVDDRFRELMESRPALDVKRLAVMVCMNMAEELYRERHLREGLYGPVAERVRRCCRSLEEVLGAGGQSAAGG